MFDMCLKIYHRYTFSNKEAFNEATMIIGTKGKYPYQTISGHIYILDTHESNVFLRDRHKLSYKELTGLYLNDLITCEYLEIHSWDAYRYVLKIAKDVDVFGEFIIEMQ